jgi:hypothetical protein
MSLHPALVAFEHHLAVAGHPVAQYWNAGLNEGQARGLLAAAGMVPTAELLALYDWKNGQAYPGVPSGKLRFGARGVFFRWMSPCNSTP